MENALAAAPPKTSEPLPEGSLIEAALCGRDLAGRDLRGRNLSRADLRGANFMGADLRDAVLFEARLDGAEFAGADLSGANLESVTGERVGFAGAVLAGASLVASTLTEASFAAADLHGAKLSGAGLRQGRFRDAQLQDADLRMADLQGVELAGTFVAGAVFDGADLRGATLSGLHQYDRASWLCTDFRDINFSGAYLLRRFAMDQNYLWEFKNRSVFHRWLYSLWRLTSDCGRSLTRWAAVIGAQIALFSVFYCWVDLDFGGHETALSPLYYSVVTFTTLGFGDVLPASPVAQLITMIEVSIGYMMLGGLLSILGSKMARRAD